MDEEPAKENIQDVEIHLVKTLSESDRASPDRKQTVGEAASLTDSRRDRYDK